MIINIIFLFSCILIDCKAEKVKDINSSNECRIDVSHLCDHIKRGSNLEILNCFQRSEKIMESITKPCQHYLWQLKKNYLNIDYFDSVSNDNCKDDKLKKCSNGAKGDIMICLLKRRNDITNKMCLLYLDEVASIIFSDIFLVSKFLSQCDVDIENLKCGRLEGSLAFVDVKQTKITSQGATINCLVQSLDNVRSECRKQILRLGELQSDDYHHDPALFYSCREDREIFCSSIVSGNSQVYRCLEKNKFDEKMSENCRIELNKKQKLEGFDYKIRKYFTEQCSKDIINHKCITSSDDKDNVELATIILCLLHADNEESEKNKLDPHCRSEVLIAREQFAKNPEMSSDVHKGCAAEIKQHCSLINKKTDSVIHCLMRNSMPALGKTFNANCTLSMKKYFRLVDPTEDIAQLDPVISVACAHELKAKCSDNNMKRPDDRYECLLQQVDDETSTDKLNDDCKASLITLAYFVERDYSLNHKLHKSCHKDAEKLCKVDSRKDKNEQSLVPHAVLHCLVQRWNSALNKSRLSYKCELEIKAIMKIEASNIKLNFRVYSSCFVDVMTLCKDDKFKMDCLQMKYHKLKTACKASISEFLSLDKEEYSMQKLIARSCGPMVRSFCSNEIEAKEKNYMQCLVRHKFNNKMDSNCRIAIEHYQIISLDNYKINHKFARFCSNEIKLFCGSLMSNSRKSLDKSGEEEEEATEATSRPISKSDIITCLSKKLTTDLLQKKNPFSSKCYEQFTFEYLQRGDDVILDPEMKKKCGTDIDIRCSKIESDDVLSCLQSYQESLNETCYGLLTNRQQLGALDSQLDGGIQRYCGGMIDAYCGKELKHRVFRCLHVNMRRDGFNKECKMKVFHRLQRRLVDVKLNPELIDNCRKEMVTMCNATDLSGHISEIYSKDKIDIVNCLRWNYLEHRKLINANCRHLVFEIVMDAHADYRLDPGLYEKCNTDLKEFCSKDLERNEVDTEGRVQDCLKHNLMNGKIRDKACFKELHRLLREGRADVHVDVQLYTACSDEISRICYTMWLGAGRKLACLLWALDDKHASPFISKQCSTVLFERRQMWELASKMDAPDNVMQVVGLIVESRAKYYLLMVAAALFMAVLLVGIICGRITKREMAVHKRR